MWDSKRQIIWLTGGFAFGTFFLYQDSFDDQNHFVPTFFIFLEILLLIVVSILFYIYSQQKR